MIADDPWAAKIYCHNKLRHLEFVQTIKFTIPLFYTRDELTIKFDHPLNTGSWVCSQCSAPNLRTGYACPSCHAVLCIKCADVDHERPIQGGICGATIESIEKIEEEILESLD